MRVFPLTLSPNQRLPQWNALWNGRARIAYFTCGSWCDLPLSQGNGVRPKVSQWKKEWHKTNLPMTQALECRFLPTVKSQHLTRVHPPRSQLRYSVCWSVSWWFYHAPLPPRLLLAQINWDTKQSNGLFRVVPWVNVHFIPSSVHLAGSLLAMMLPLLGLP